MASNNKREYTVKINGISQSLTDITSLNAALNEMDAALSRQQVAAGRSAQSSRQQTAALTDEEKAAIRLANTRNRLANVESEANRAQIEANIQLREATRELTRRIQVEQFAEGSMRAMGMQLTDLRNEYEGLSAAQRADIAVGGELLKQIQALDAEYKGLRESTGNFRDSVGNYEKATKGLGSLRDGFKQASGGALKLATDVGAGNGVMNVFGTAAEGAGEKLDSLYNIMMLATLVSTTYANITKDATLAQQAAAVMDAVRAVQLKAKTAAEALATRGTVLATIAQKAFNLVAAANPYVLLALAIVAVGAALFAFANSTDTAAEKQRKINELQAIYLDQLDQEAVKLREVGEARIKAAQQALELLQAQGAKLGEVRKAEDQLFNARVNNNARLRGFYGEELANLDANKKRIEELTEVMRQLNIEKAKGDNTVAIIDVDLDGKPDTVKIDDAITSVQGIIDNLNRSVKIAVDLDTERKDLEHQARVVAAARVKADADLAKERAKAAEEARKAELAAVRAGEDARLALVRNSYQREQQEIRNTNKRAIEDLRDRLRTEKTLTAAARKAINDNIVSLEKLLTIQLEELREEREAKSLDITRATEDSRLRLIVSSSERQREELNTAYDRQIEDIHLRLRREHDLTEEEGRELTETMLNLRKERDAELAKLDAAALQAQADRALAAAETAVSQLDARMGEATRRSKTGLQLIDVDATEANLAKTRAALTKYVADVRNYQTELTAAHNAVIETLAEGTPEYEAELDKYANAMEAAEVKIISAEKRIDASTKESKDLRIAYWQELLGKVAEIATEIAGVIGGVADTFNMGLQAQIDDMTAELENLDKQYEEVAKKRDDSVKQTEDLEARLRDASGGTAEALREQLASAAAARNELNREEQRLAKEKEKREADIARKERQIRRNDLMANIAQGLANTAQGVTRMLSLIWPLNLVMAGVVGVAGAAQVAIMSRQLAKLETGGRIEGPRHAQGGVNINVQGKPSYEAEGGEFMVNRMAYGANARLVEFINTQTGPVSFADMAAYSAVPPTGEVPREDGTTRMLEALDAIDFAPVVSVEEITDAQRNVATVKDLSGF